MTRSHNLKGRARPARCSLRVAASFAAAVALAVTVLGCDEQGRLSERMALSLNDPQEHHKIGFVARPEVLHVELPPGGGGLSHNQFADVYRFLRRFRAESNGRLTISMPGNGIRAGVASSRALDDVRQALREAEIDERTVDRSSHPVVRRQGATLRLSYLRPMAVPPRCGLWYRDVGVEPERVPYPQWGCATQRNVAGMVANARDLQRPQDEDPSSSERRSSLWSKYIPPSGVAPTEDSSKAKAPATTNK
jgi:pilus assembly protein CpaD